MTISTTPPISAINGRRRWVRVWDMPLRLFHWLLVVAVALAFLSSEEGSVLNDWHVLSGWAAGILIVFRLLWGFVGGEHSRFSEFIRPSSLGHHISGLVRGSPEPSLGHNPLGAVAVVLLLGLTAAVVWTGAFGGEAFEDLHELIAWTLLGMVGLHIAAVIVMSLLERENLARAMVTGNKPATRHSAAHDARRPSVAALVLAAVVIAGTAYAVLRYDPQAFALRGTEAFEHRSGAAVERSEIEEAREHDE